ncbi:N-acetyltransferase [Jeotgalicoccus coquinae]|uniref:Protease synthase and sporulation negative regulatory protein PAI 1 n=1 Tax=Jeotgalicoccus coquinae TaxID=709509 RepID=A0A6V7RLW3_9STAP|nr:ribosomal protein S18 acetylase RimI-like enzyme [Jeotgalicoccus coquinae]GGE17701.1 N-acetyltransferase [Jeotgalicoccus coquinae]CAD2079250.1 Protease synthase and sporulation negative regulatory protein PAI 1 [Jeotgalicoccus coquinae]
MITGDIEQVQAVAKESWHATYEGIIPREIQQNFLNGAYSDEMMERRMENSLMLVAEAENTIAGFANFTPVNKQGQTELSAIYLLPQYQGEGIGSALLNTGVKKLENLKEIQLDVEKENIIGTAFYKAKGFKTVDEYDENFGSHILKTVRMELIL